jgi:hypothetical protein
MCSSFVQSIGHRQKTAQIRDGILACCHLAQMVLPYVGLDRAAGEGLARDRHYFSAAIHTWIGDRRNHEADARTRSPVTAGKIMRKEHRVVASLCRQEGKSRFSSRPHRLNVRLEPAPKFEAIELGLIEQKPQQVCAIHSRFPFLAGFILLPA